MRGRVIILLSLAILIVLMLGLLPGLAFISEYWALTSMIFLILVSAAFFWDFEVSRPSSLEISLVATLAALAAVGRVPFAVLPSVQPTTFLVMMTGWVFGSRNGFVVGALAALASNIFLGQGPWTPWQMFGWGSGGAVAGVMARYYGNRPFPAVVFAMLTFFWGYIFGWLMNIWHWASFIYPLTLETFIATYIASFPFDTMHAVGNITFSFVFGPMVHSILIRFKKRMFYQS